MEDWKILLEGESLGLRQVISCPPRYRSPFWPDGESELLDTEGLVRRLHDQKAR